MFERQFEQFWRRRWQHFLAPNHKVEHGSSHDTADHVDFGATTNDAALNTANDLGCRRRDG